MKSIFKTGMLLTSIFLIGVSVAQAQASFKIGSNSGNSMLLSGTSTFHDWTMATKTFTGNAQFAVKENEITALKSLDFSLPVLQLKGDKKALNTNAYKALKTDLYKNIMYKLKSAKVAGRKESKFQVSTTGILTISGVTKEVSIDIYCVANKNGSVTATGTYKIKMTDYKVEPPKFMGGMMTTGDDLTLDFAMIFEK